jgi:hypothetical protein
MSFIGTMGVVAQQGNQSVVGPTVNISTSSSGNYADDMIVYSEVLADLPGEPPLISYTGGSASSSAPHLTFSLDQDDFFAAQNSLGSGTSRIYLGGYTRAVAGVGSIQSYQYNITGIDTSNMDQTGNYFTSAVSSGTPIEVADGTSDVADGDGYEINLRMAFPSGKGGIVTPEAGDYLTFVFNAHVQDEGIIVTTDSLTIKLEWTN